MTCIAWDGKFLAADKAATSAGYRRTVTKVYRVPGGAVGFSGDGDWALLLLEWFRAGRDPDAYPACQKDDAVTVFFATDAGELLIYGKTPHPQRSEDAFDAGGSGRDYALATMHLGWDARRAVEVASRFDNNCGNGIDVIQVVA